MKIAVVGATGLVGQLMIEILEERNFPLTELIPVASDRSVSREIKYLNKSLEIIGLDEALERKADLVIFSAGSEIAIRYAPLFSGSGTTVIDNSSAWRMEPGVKLIVPEINSHLLSGEDKIISNPNCSTIQLVMVLSQLHKQFRIRRVVVSTYQSVSGSGSDAIQQFENERNSIRGEMSYPHPIDRNCIPHCDDFLDNGYTREEMKLIRETRKILEEPELMVTATAVRVPVSRGHSEAVNIEFENDFDLNEIRDLLEEAAGVTVLDDPSNNIYPMPVHAEGKDSVFVGRIRRDLSRDNALNLWIVADNLRKGAATNAIQIAEYLLSLI